MATVTGRKRAVRFEIPGGKARLKRLGVLSFLRRFSVPFPLLNISKGGIAVATDEEFRRGQKVKVQLLVPDEAPVDLLGRVLWQNESENDFSTTAGIGFMPFGGRFGWNSRRSLDVLRRLEERYRD